jgi:hypothetical protein
MDIIGTIYDIDRTDPENPVSTPLDGFHINTTQPLQGLDDYLVEPEVPQQVFAGVVTYHYRFDNEQQAKDLIGYDSEDGWQPQYVPKPEPVPASVTKRQAKQWLISSGMLAGVQPTIDAITDDTQRALVQNYWDNSNEFERDNQFLNTLWLNMGGTGEQLDQAFRGAVSL